MSAMSWLCPAEGTLWLVPVLAVVVAHLRWMSAVADKVGKVNDACRLWWAASGGGGGAGLQLILGNA
jgi:hypothetical protein